MRLLGPFLAILMAFALAACAAKPPAYEGPEVTSILILKGERTMHLMNGNTSLRQYDIELGFAPEGDKVQENDGKTPEGAYYINRRNPRSQYHLSLGISYPDRNDVAQAEALGVKPGGDIFIHGTPERFLGKEDWTWGCIAVTNAEIEEIWFMVRDGTKVFIQP